MNSELDDCTVTFDQTRDALADVERRLARKYDIYTGVRLALMKMDRSGRLVDDDLADEWRAIYNSFLDWLEWMCKEPPSASALAL